MTRVALPGSVTSQKLIPLARGLDKLSAVPLAETIEAAGIDTLEVTLESEVGYEALRAVAGGRLVVGAGTITSIEGARRAVDIGAEFLVCPHFDERLVEWAVEAGIPILPGGLTPTEIHRAWSAGASAVKVFPVSLGGPGYIRGVLAPFPDIALVPTGGVDAGNVGSYLEAGAVAAGVGSWLTGSSDMEIVSRRASEIMRAVV